MKRLSDEDLESRARHVDPADPDATEVARELLALRRVERAARVVTEQRGPESGLASLRIQICALDQEVGGE